MFRNVPECSMFRVLSTPEPTVPSEFMFFSVTKHHPQDRFFVVLKASYELCSLEDLSDFSFKMIFEILIDICVLDIFTRQFETVVNVGTIISHYVNKRIDAHFI